jgi:hypothetical protein
VVEAIDDGVEIHPWFILWRRVNCQKNRGDDKNFICVPGRRIPNIQLRMQTPNKCSGLLFLTGYGMLFKMSVHVFADI